MIGRMMLFGGHGEETLDRPISNFDVIGIPTDRWSSHFCAWYENVIPSGFLSFFCPCVIWGQIVVRAQIPMLISIKNSMACCRMRSGFGLFVDYYFWSVAISVVLIVMLACYKMPSLSVLYIVSIVIIIVLGCFLYATGHSYTAFRDKYRLPSLLPPGCTFWEKIVDTLTITLCFPCVLSRMARHVFQYHRMDEPIGMFVGDPYHLPPLRPLDEETGHFERPLRADAAGLPEPNAIGQQYTGAAHRQQALLAQQHAQIMQPAATHTTATRSPVPVATAVYQ